MDSSNTASLNVALLVINTGSLLMIMLAHCLISYVCVTTDEIWSDHQMPTNVVFRCYVFFGGKTKKKYLSTFSPLVMIDHMPTFAREHNLFCFHQRKLFSHCMC
eukprot:TRINITY_DN8872_c0_g1_i1.p1 TRINITY_DN8872_c0_g1~~TRINITY_DN8872_c0_g1_i1.p1  ORF type:complete len:104 (-),score=0.32 TRINITY_DN8872_c0_g1_i1:241-552(-)